MLVNIWQDICTNLEDYRVATVLTSIDYAKAFNWLSFQHCLNVRGFQGWFPFRIPGRSTRLINYEKYAKSFARGESCVIHLSSSSGADLTGKQGRHTEQGIENIGKMAYSHISESNLSENIEAPISPTVFLGVCYFSEWQAPNSPNF